MKVELTREAKKQLAKIPKQQAKKIAKKLLLLDKFPLSGKKLHGDLDERFSLKAWPYRIVYVFFRKKSLIQVEVIAHRQGVYK